VTDDSTFDIHVCIRINYVQLGINTKSRFNILVNSPLKKAFDQHKLKKKLMKFENVKCL